MRPRFKIGGACPVTSSDRRKAALMNEVRQTLESENKVSFAFIHFAKVFGKWDRIGAHEVEFYKECGFQVKSERV